MADRPDIQQQSISIPARDGYDLGATHFSGQASRDVSSGVIVFNSATATPQTFYFRCARFFAAQGFDVYTYDYRGIAQSAPATLRGFDAMMHTLAETDMPGVIDYVHGKHPSQQLIAIGHSVRGQLLGMLDNGSLIDKAITFSSQSGYWKLQGGNQKLMVLFTMYFMLPGLTRLFGYFPWKRFGGGENLPKGAALEWAKWCRSPNYLFDDRSLPHLDRYAEFEAPILAYCFADDDWGTRKAVRSLMDHYTGAPLEYRDVEPADFGLKSIGHFGYFKRGSERLWQDTLNWIQSDSPK
jgi:predicted alpha/beta hydrolase